MDFKQAKVAASHFVASAARSAQTSPFGGTAKASDDTGITPTNQSLLDTFNTIATEGVAPTFDPSSDPLRALRAAINGSKGISPDVTIPTVDQILKEADKTGNSLVDGTLMQQYEDLKLIYTTERLALEDLVARGAATSQDVKDLKQFTKVLTTLSTEIAEITKRQPVQKALYQQEIDALKAFGVKHADDKYHTISKDDIAQYDLNGDGNIGSPLEGSKLYTGVVVGIQTIEGKENYSFLDKVTMLGVKFDPVSGVALSAGISNPSYVWNLSESGLEEKGHLVKDGQYVDGGGVTGFTTDVDVSFGIKGTFLGNRLAYEGSPNTYNTQVDIPVPQSVWIKKYPDGTDIEHEPSGGTKVEAYLEGLETGTLAAPPADIRDDFRQVDVAQCKLTSEKSGDGGNHVLIFMDADDRILFKMGISGTSNVAALGDLGTRLQSSPDAGYIAASSFSLALSTGYDMGSGSKGDTNQMRRSPIKLEVDESFISTTNGGMFDTQNSPLDGQSYLDGLKTNKHNARDAQKDSLAFFANQEKSVHYIGGQTEQTAQWETEAFGKWTKGHEQTWTQHKLGADFELNQANGPMAMGLSGHLKMGQFNSVVEEGPRPTNIDHLDTAWKSLVDLGGGYNVFVGRNGNHHIRNATYVDIQGDAGDINYIQVSQTLSWEAVRMVNSGDADNWGEGEPVGKPKTLIHKDNPAVYVRVNTPNGKTVIDNEKESLVLDDNKSGTDEFFNSHGDANHAEFDLYDSMLPEGPQAGVDSIQYRDDKYDLTTGDYEFTNVEEYDLPIGAKQNTSGFDPEALLKEYMDAEKAFDEELKKVPDLGGEGELLEGEAMWEVYGPNYAEAQQSLTDFFAQYREQFDSSVPMDPALEPEPDLDGAEKALDKKIGSTI